MKNSMKTARTVFFVFVAFGFLACGADSEKKANIEREHIGPGGSAPFNVILISLDTLRADHLGCYGYSRPTSPFLDQLANRGVLFENAIAQVPGTLPSHMSMFTGLFPKEHDVFPPDDVLSADIPTLPEILSDAGVRSAGFTEGGYVSGRFGFARGFEQFDDSARKINTDIEDVFQRGLGFLGSLGPDERFFLFLHTYAIHDPYFPPPPYIGYYLPETDLSLVDQFEPVAANVLDPPTSASMDIQAQKYKASVSLIETYLPTGAPLPTGPELAALNRQGRSISPEALAFYEALYDATINYADDVVKLFFSRLEQMGLADNTVVILTSDHGEEFLEHGRFTHEQVYHECLHVPLLVVGPGVVQSRRIRDLVMTIDLMPTILDIYGLPTPDFVSGRSLDPLLASSATPLEARDAHAIGVVDPSESLYRIINNEAHQVVSQTLRSPEGGRWVSRDITLETTEPILRCSVMSYHHPRILAVSIDGREPTSLDVTPEWKEISLDLPGDGRRHTINFTSPSCESPYDHGEGPDKRCLAFCIRDFPTNRTQLFNVSVDPAGAIDLASQKPRELQQLLTSLSKFRHLPPLAGSEAEPLDEATRQRLKELGYLQ